jgi:hypothetical protein
MVGVTVPHHRRFAYDKQRHYPSRSRRRCAGHRRSRCRHSRRRRGAKLHDEHQSVHQQHGEYAGDDDTVEHHYDTVYHDAEDADLAAGIRRSPLPEHGRQVRLRVQLGLWLELGLGLRRRSPDRRRHPVATAPWG